MKSEWVAGFVSESLADFSGIRSLLDDDAVAVTHAPPELGYVPVTVPLVNVIWTMATWLRKGHLTQAEALIIEKSARSIFFKNRTWREIFELAMLSPHRIVALMDLAKTDQVDRKALDAEMLVREVAAMPDRRGPQPSWEFSRTDQFLRFIAQPPE